MNVGAANRWITLVANVGVLAGIVFLAFEIRQNNELLSVQASYAQFNIVRERRTRLIENVGGLADLVTRQTNGEELSETDFQRLLLNWLDIVDSWEWQYRENRAGRLPDDVMNIEDWQIALRLYPALREQYERTKPRRDQDFLRFMDERVLPQQVGASGRFPPLNLARQVIG